MYKPETTNRLNNFFRRENIYLLDERAISQLICFNFGSQKDQKSSMNYLLRIILDMLQSLPNLLAYARYAVVKTVPDRLLNLRIENARNKFTQKILLRNDHMTINLQSTTNTNPGFNV